MRRFSQPLAAKYYKHPKPGKVFFFLLKAGFAVVYKFKCNTLLFNRKMDAKRPRLC